MNRDERLNRAPADPPRVVQIDEAEVILPRDSEGGGAWIGVNSHGLAVALANVYPDPAPPVPESRISRGLLVSDALRCRDQAEVTDQVRKKELVSYEPFQLVALTPGASPCSLVWDGRTAHQLNHPVPGMITTSSSRDQDGAHRIRRALFQNAAEAEGGLTDQLLEDLHRSREPEPGPYAISMERSDAATLSMSTIRVSAGAISFSYTPGPPHRTEAGPSLIIRRSAPAPPRPIEPRSSTIPR